jgi:hypothetical protein
MILLWLCVTLPQAKAQVSPDTVKIRPAGKKKVFVPPSKIVISTGIASDSRYTDIVNRITSEYNASIDKGYYPIGLNGTQIKFDDKKLDLNCKDIKLKNTFNGGEYPLSYSVLFKGHLVSLFEPGMFMCINLSNFKRDTEFEKILNVKKFDYHWLIQNRLIAKANGSNFELKDNKWVSYNEALPLTNSPVLYQDEQYICYANCNGEFGGEVYFYNKQTKETHVTEATCAVTVYHENGKYYVLSNLGHMMGFTDLVEITDPEKLRIKTSNVKIMRDTTGKKSLFSYQGIQLFSTFEINAQHYYLAYWFEMPFLARVENNVIYIADPLLGKEIYMHNAITTNYNGTTLITYSFYGESRERECASIIIDHGNFTRINW